MRYCEWISIGIGVLNRRHWSPELERIFGFEIETHDYAMADPIGVY